jgi:hypothetical protein
VDTLSKFRQLSGSIYLTYKKDEMRNEHLNVWNVINELDNIFIILIKHVI